jgi:formyltetrahydrofolate synthetase
MLQHQQEGQSDPLAEGFENLGGHVDNLRRFNLPVVVAVNRHPDDDEGHVRRLLAEAVKRGATAAVECFHFARGGEGAVDLAKAIVEATESASPPEPRGIYTDDAPVKDKVEAIATIVYGAGSVDWSDEALEGLRTAERLGLGRARPCMVKTQYSFSARPKVRGRPRGHVLPIREVRCWNGANLVVPLVGAVLTLPGLPERPGAADYDVDAETMAIVHRR